MKRKYNIFQIDAFTRSPFQGNPAAVTFGLDLTDEEMQLIAREMNLSETAFITTSDKADYRLRWFTPAKEVKLCGHATIASLHYLSELGKIVDRPRITFETLSGVLTCPVNKDEYQMQIPVMNMEEFEGEHDDIIAALGAERGNISSQHPFILLENGYLYVYIESLSALKELRPDYNLMLDLSRKYGFTAINAFSLETYDKDSFAHSRFFAPFFGINEDPVTGSANGPLMLVLIKLGFIKDDNSTITKTFEQGDIIERRGRIKVTYTPLSHELYIGGTAVTVFRGELNI